MATLNSASSSSAVPSPGHDAPSPPPDTSSSTSDPVTKDPPDAPATSESVRSSEPGAERLESGCGLVPPKEIGDPQGEPGCGHIPPKDLGVEKEEEEEEEEETILPLDLSNHLFFAAGGKAYLLAKLSVNSCSGGSELLLPKGFPWDEANIQEEPSLPLLAHFPSSHLTTLHIQHGFDPTQGFSSSDQILSHDTSVPSLAACEGRDGSFWSYQLVPNPSEDPKDGPLGSQWGDHRALFWICLLCRLGFSRLRAFIGHTHSHGVKLTPAHHQGLLGSPAILQEGDEGSVAFLSFLEPKLACPSPKVPDNSTVTTVTNGAQTEDGPPEADIQALVLPTEEVMALSPPSPSTALTTWDPSPTQAKESPVSRGEAGPDWFPEGQEEDGGLCLPLNQSSPTSKEAATLPAPVGSPEDASDPPQSCRLIDDYTPAPAAFQGLSLSSHMSLLHSRNSCKTLKCPKCNWHYKYQQTLDVHMREKHPESNSHCSYCSAGGAHPRLARGESYNCGYKPYRCDVCNYSTTTKGNLSIHMQSDKHLANLQGFQAGPGGQGSPPEASLPPPSVGDKEPKAKSSWQCKVCSYETNISRNLRIHMTSEKHMQNVLMLHQGLPLGLPPGLVGPGPPPPPPPGTTPTNPPELFQYFGPQALGQPQTPLPGPGLRPDKPLEAHLLLNGLHHLGAPSRKFLTTAPGSLSPETHLPPSHLLGSSSDGLPASPSPDDSPPLKVFRCLVCQAFSTDSLELLLYHCSIGRSLPEAEWKEVAGDTHRCKLCCYSTQLKANFQLHLKTDKHTQKYQLAAHLREGGGAMGTPSPLPLGDGASYGSVSPLHLRCNICDFESNSKEKMQLHARGSAHEENSQIYKFLLDMEGAEAGPELGLYRCLLCAWDTPSRLAVLQHLRTPAHRDAQAQRRLQLLQNGPSTEEGLSALQNILSFSHGRLRTPGKTDTPSSKPPTSEKDAQNKTEQLASGVTEDRTGPSTDSANQITVYCCPYCSFLSPESDQVRVHTLSQHAVQPKYRCPLCQEQLMGRPALHFHLSHLHNVVPECVEKLLLVATTVEMTFATKMLPGLTPTPVEDGLEHPTPGPEPTPSRDQVAESSNLTPEASPDPPEPLPAPVEGPEKPLGSPEQPSSPVSSPAPQLDAQVEEVAAPPAMAEEEEGAMGEPRSAEPSPADSRHPLTYRKTTNFALDKFLDPARPFKCTVCKESFTQKNILLVHYNSVSHLHKMKKAAIDPSCPARGEAGIPPPTSATSDKPFKCTVCRVSYNQSSTLEIHMRSVLHQTRSRGAKADAKAEGPERSQEELKEGETEGEVGTEKKGPDPSGFMSGLPFLSPPPPLFTPPVLPPFPLVPESLLKLQQQQLLLPFYLHDLKVGPKLALASPTPMLSLPAATPPPLPAPPKAELPEQEWERPLIAEEGNEAGPSSPPHTSPNDAARTAAKALLENFGFELVIQYNEGKQAVPPPPTPPPPESLGGGDKLACGACGKLFSNMLILKSHEEHVHRRFLPFEALSRYAAQFRKSYDSLYPPPVEAPKPPDGSLESPPQIGPPFMIPEPEVAGIHASEERSLAGGHWPLEEDDGSRGSLPHTVPAGRRFSRTKFTEFQTQALQSFFETSAYPKDGEVERLANLLGLASRVVVVWFQNARQKARKNACEGGSVTAGGSSGGASGCRRCHTTFACVFELVRHLKKCYDDQPPEEEEEAERGEEEEEVEEEEAEEQNPEPAARQGGPSPEHADVEDPSQVEPARPEGKEEPEGKAPPSPATHTCDQCAVSFSSQDLLTAHHRLHFPPCAAQPSAPPQLLDLPLLVFGERNPVVSGTSSVTGTPLKRKHDDGSLSPTGSEAGGGGEGEPPKDKRLRTTILPEQLEILYRWYMQDSNPTRKMLDCISEEVGLKKRVVQVWFQNTRARERKGQFRSTPGGVAGPAVKPTVTPTPAPFPKFNLLLSKTEDDPGKEAPKREAPAFPYPTVTPAAGPLSFLPPGTPGKEATVPTPEPPVPLPVPALSEDEGPEEPSKASPESEACSPSAGDLSDSSTSSLAEPESPGAGGTSGAPGSGSGVPDAMGQRRYRTQMSSLQLKIMKACYEAYRTPTMQECEVLGEEIGLPKRVIQVWFQNARAKEKKAKLQGTALAGSGSGSEGALAAQRTDCPYCDVKYDFYVSCRGHLFSRQHLAKLKEAVRAQLKSESKCYDLAPAPEAPLAPKGPPAPAPPATTPASVPLGPSPTLPRLAPVLLPGPTLAQPPLGSMASFNSGPAASSGLLGLASSVLPATTVVQTAGPGHPLPQRPVSNQTNSSSTDPTPGPATDPSGDKVSGERKPVATLSNSSTDALKNLKALKATVPALLGGQFLPFPLPPAGGAAPPAVFGPQLQGAYFQQLYGMKKGLFPMNPVIPQTLIGLLPNALLQPPPQAPEPTATAPPKPPELPAPGEGDSSEADELLTGSAGISTVDVTHRYLCRQCKMAFDGEGPATAHQRSFCFFGRGSGGSMPPPLRVPICTYHCLACEVLLSGREALASHLRSSAHRRKTAPPPGGPPITVTNSATAVPAAVAFAKEEARLPHTDPNPKTTTTSTLLAL